MHDDALTAEYVPAAHAEQDEVPSAPLKDPATQSVQELAPEDETVPAKQFVQADDPGVAAILPATQAVQTSTPLE